MTQTKKVTAAKTVATKSNATNSEVVVLGTCTYHYYRNWLKDIIISAGIKASFVRPDKTTYNGEIKVAKADAAKTKSVILAFQKKEQSINMVTFSK